MDYADVPQMGVSRTRGSGRWQAVRRGTALVLVALVCVLGRAQASLAADFSCAGGNVSCLIAAITTANSNGGTNTITLAAPALL